MGLKSLRPTTTIVSVTIAAITAGWVIAYVAQFPMALGEEFSLLWLLMGIISVLCAFPLYVERKKKSFDLFNAKNVFILYIFMQYVMWPAYIILAGYQTWAGTRITFLTERYDDTVWGFVCVIVGLLAFYLGYYLPASRGSKRIPAEITMRAYRLGLTLIIVVLTIGGLLSFITLIREQQELRHYLLHIDEFRTFNLLGKGYLYYGMNLLFLAFLALYITHIVEGGYQKAAVLLFTCAIGISLVGAFRHMTVETIVALLVVYHYGRKRIVVNLKFVILALLFLVLNLMYVSFRGRQGDPLDIYLSSPSMAYALFEGFLGRFHGIESLARIIDVTTVTGFSGAFYIIRDLLVGWIPRAVWPDKPISSGLTVNLLFFGDAYLGYETGASVPSLIGSLYWIGGVGGVLWGMFFIGVTLRKAYKYLLRHQDLFGLGLYAQIYIFALLVNEDLGLHLARLVYRMLVWGFIVLCCGRRITPIFASKSSNVQSL